VYVCRVECGVVCHACTLQCVVVWYGMCRVWSNMYVSCVELCK
jgi:hypothetical protein